MPDDSPAQPAADLNQAFFQGQRAQMNGLGLDSIQFCYTARTADEQKAWREGWAFSFGWEHGLRGGVARKLKDASLQPKYRQGYDAAVRYGAPEEPPMTAKQFEEALQGTTPQLPFPDAYAEGLAAYARRALYTSNPYNGIYNGITPIAELRWSSGWLEASGLDDGRRGRPLKQWRHLSAPLRDSYDRGYEAGFGVVDKESGLVAADPAIGGVVPGVTALSVDGGLAQDYPGPRPSWDDPAHGSDPDGPTEREVENAVRTLIRWAGDDPTREGLVDTPARVRRAYREFFAGYAIDPVELLRRSFEETDNYDELVLLRNIRLETHCEHHMVPIIGVCHIAYIPGANGRVVGISKLARIVDVFAKRLQIQEKLTAQIANLLMEEMQPLGVGVVIEAAHQCMTTRGVHKPGVTMVTSRMLGVFREDADARRELLALIGSSRSTGPV